MKKIKLLIGAITLIGALALVGCANSSGGVSGNNADSSDTVDTTKTIYDFSAAAGTYKKDEYTIVVSKTGPLLTIDTRTYVFELVLQYPKNGKITIEDLPAKSQNESVLLDATVGLNKESNALIVSGVKIGSAGNQTDKSSINGKYNKQ